MAGVDAWLWAAEFDELLAMGSRSSGPSPQEPTRCLLFPNPYLAEEVGPFGFRKHAQLQRSRSQPSLLLDVDDDAIRVIDPDGDVLRASALLTEVTATPATFQPDSVGSADGSTHHHPAIAGVIIGVPGVEPLTIGCLDVVGPQFRYSWPADVPRSNQRPAYVVSVGDWLTLIERFGLTGQLRDSATR
ncbi:hypothetical protein ACGFK1_07175 [Mycobacterium sp. NPDC048908]|uniref:hypothetical protein n=1 Tax=Mycobacterium sp. NPDC048908 TaxID=3364292 RepID=UPI00372265F8